MRIKHVLKSSFPVLFMRVNKQNAMKDLRFEALLYWLVLRTLMVWIEKTVRWTELHHEFGSDDSNKNFVLSPFSNSSFAEIKKLPEHLRIYYFTSKNYPGNVHGKIFTSLKSVLPCCIWPEVKILVIILWASCEQTMWFWGKYRSVHNRFEPVTMSATVILS